ncbi:DUF429 domain-containing protein [Streptomyces alkaliphilus]|uniref:DUF429 domain-containing protein n=1 Tax=Streptomyces alkaliphilus TaxID=1472722 RepID=UPI00117E3C82|nr:DUF429 domain-containing protein [Streptomyces alkaliphilus]MQS08064.1 DUF429 domain-containing protein [Streptomyces alkaliphilus]
MRRSVGVDLAVNARTTAVAEIRWDGDGDGAAAGVPVTGCRDEYLLDLLSGLGEGEAAGVDCPFGWPIAFAEAVAAHADHRPWPGHADREGHYRDMRLRMTDRVTDAALRPLTGRGPLSVSMDKLGATAARWAHLAHHLAERGHPVDRAGAGRVVEVYPAGSRAVWGLTGARSTGALVGVMPWLRFEPGAQAAYERNEHAFDALIAALTARCAVLGLTSRPGGAEEEGAAAVEGWIHLPAADAPARLAPGRS